MGRKRHVDHSWWPPAYRPVPDVQPANL